VLDSHFSFSAGACCTVSCQARHPATCAFSTGACCKREERKDALAVKICRGREARFGPSRRQKRTSRAHGDNEPNGSPHPAAANNAWAPPGGPTAGPTHRRSRGPPRAAERVGSTASPPPPPGRRSAAAQRRRLLLPGADAESRVFQSKLLSRFFNFLYINSSMYFRAVGRSSLC
jgi:hypothetical protein